MNSKVPKIPKRRNGKAFEVPHALAINCGVRRQVPGCMVAQFNQVARSLKNRLGDDTHFPILTCLYQMDLSESKVGARRRIVVKFKLESEGIPVVHVADSLIRC